MNTAQKQETKQANHTQGPWFINPKGFVVDSTGSIVTRMECSEDSGNVQLIAAAPEMLALLERLTHPMATDEDSDEARALVATIRGGTP